MNHTSLPQLLMLINLLLNKLSPQLRGGMANNDINVKGNKKGDNFSSLPIQINQTLHFLGFSIKINQVI